MATAVQGACPETVHYGERESANRLTIHGETGVRHFHMPSVAVVYRMISPNDHGLEIRFPRFAPSGDGRSSYIWPRLVGKFDGETGTYPVYEQAVLSQQTFGCFAVPPDDYTTSRFAIKEWRDPREGDGYLKATIERTTQDGYGYTAKIDSRDVVILKPVTVQGQFLLEDDFSGETKKVDAQKGYFAYTPASQRLKIKLFASNNITAFTIDDFDPAKEVIGVSGVSDKKLFIVNEFSQNKVDIEWRILPFASAINIHSIADPTKARALGKTGGHIVSEHGYTRIPQGTAIPLGEKHGINQQNP